MPAPSTRSSRPRGAEVVPFLRPRGQRPGRTRRAQALLAAALELFVEKGYAATRLEDVADRAGVAKGTIYLYFSDKEELFRALVREGIAPVLDQSDTLAAGFEGGAARLLREVLRLWWRLLASTPLAGLPKLILAEARNFPELARYFDETVMRRGRRLVGGVLEQGMAAGEFRRMEVETAIDVIVAPLLMLAVWNFSIGPCCEEAGRDPLAYLDTHFDLVLRGLLEPPACKRRPARLFLVPPTLRWGAAACGANLSCSHLPEPAAGQAKTVRDAANGFDAGGNN